MAMSAKSRLECSLLVVVVGVSICDAILGGTKQTRHAAWMLCKVMSRIGNFCGAVRGYFHKVMHAGSFYDCCFIFFCSYHPVTWNMFWQCMAILHPIDCMQFHTSSVGSTVHFKVKMGQHCGETYWFNMIYSNLMFVALLEFDMLHSCNAGAQSPSESFGNTYSYSPPQRTWPKIWYIKFGGGEHYWLRIKDILRIVRSSRRIKAHRIPASDFYILLLFQGLVFPSDWIRGTAWPFVVDRRSIPRGAVSHTLAYILFGWPSTWMQLILLGSPGQGSW